MKLPISQLKKILKEDTKCHIDYSDSSLSFPLAAFLCVLCLTPALLPAALSCPPPCLCYSDGLVDCGGRGLSSLPPLHLLPPGSHSLVLANNKLASLGASAFSNFSTLEVRLQTQNSLEFLLSCTRRSVVVVCTAVPRWPSTLHVSSAIVRGDTLW